MAYTRFGSRLSEGKLNVPTGFAPLLLFSVCNEMWMPTGHCRPSRFSSTSAQPGWYHSTGTVFARTAALCPPHREERSDQIGGAGATRDPRRPKRLVVGSQGHGDRPAAA